MGWYKILAISLNQNTESTSNLITKNISGHLCRYFLWNQYFDIGEATRSSVL